MTLPRKFTKYSRAATDEICDRVEAGEPVSVICTERRLPSQGAVGLWKRINKDGFALRYAAARRKGSLLLRRRIGQKHSELDEAARDARKIKEMTLPKKLVAVNEAGRRIGQDHPRAKLTNHEIDLLLRLRDEGWGYRRLARKFDLCRSHVRYIVKGLRRCQFAALFKLTK